MPGGHEIPESRNYVHATCGAVTGVTGEHLEAVVSPVPGAVRTVCSTCGTAFPVEEFRWEGTGEALPAYYARYRASLSGRVRWFCARSTGLAVAALGLLAGLAAGAWTWGAVGPGWGVGVGLVGALVGGVGGLVAWSALHARLLARALGVPDVRCLR